MRLGAHVDELVHAQQKEIHADVNVDGAHAGHGGADGEAGDGVFRQRRIHDAARPKLIDQAVGGALDGLVERVGGSLPDLVGAAGQHGQRV